MKFKLFIVCLFFTGCTPKLYVVGTNATYSSAVAYKALKNEFHHTGIEESRAVIFNKNMEVLTTVLAGVGTRDKVTGNFASVLSTAKSLGGTFIVVAHNHPSGNVLPSDADKRNFRWVCTKGKEYGMEVIDSLIITSDDYLSLRDFGVFKHLSWY